MITSWYMVMKIRISTHAVARTLLGNYNQHKPLTKMEAARVRIALENSGVHDANNRLNAGFARLILTEVL